MRQLPFRPGNEITQSFNGGLVAIYTVTDGAQPGRLPVPVLEKKLTLRYEERQLGIQRYYSARQNQVKIERVIRVPRTGRVSSQDVAVTGDGRQYRVDWVQSVRDVYPPSVDLTLAAVEQVYALPDQQKKPGQSPGLL